MKTLKFGGTSLANAKKFIQVSSIIINQTKINQISVVLSAPATITNHLEMIVLKCIRYNNVPAEELTTLKNFFLKLTKKIYATNKKYPKNNIQKKITKQCEKLQKLLNLIKLFKKCPDKIYAQVISMGEILSVKIMKELLMSYGHDVLTINPVKLISATSNYLNAIVKIHESKKNFKNLNVNKKKIILMPGFIAGNKSRELVVLGRNGSDYSASILSVCTNSHTCEIWTDVNGIYTSDPNIISTAKFISEITYQEALELSYFGAKIIHPASVKPLQIHNIPCIIKNTNNPNYPGTLLTIKNNNNIDIIKGITYLKKIILIKITKIKESNQEKILNKTFKYLSKKNITTYLLNQSLSNNTISFYIQNNPLLNIKLKLKKALSAEIQKKSLKIVLCVKKLSIISIIGYNIKKYNIDILKKICLVVNSFKNKILEVSYNTSKISLSVVLHDKHIIDITEKIHDLILYKTIPVNIFLIGIGGVGSKLLDIILMQEQKLKKIFIQLNVNVIANSTTYIENKKKISLIQWKKQFNQSNQLFILEKILNLVKKNGYLYPVLIDCTASQDIAEKYKIIMKKGFHIITANKKSNSSFFSNYKSIRKIAQKYNKKFFYETHVGAGLPILNNLKNLIKSGDQLIKFQGILSGSMSYIFGKLDGNTSLSDAIKQAQTLGFTEPNPQDDLLGTDVARKLLIIAREFGYKLELSDITIEKILPDSFNKSNHKKEFFLQLKKLNNIFIRQINKAKNEKKVLRFVGTIKNNGSCNIKIKAVDNKNPLYYVKNGENIFVFYTKYYQPIPLILRGYGAGNEVTASGIFSDLLRVIL
ncbi:Bifunctional aspartokinase/homoserine dehydrogenase 1 [Buchnera aphidicola (Cinara pseudotaxifoliae)]|uniref:Bifunctional aspartokinase/homoserine dehydrogenase n=1 Tax=Buchnera aphidicola (Cinara pseudotaxifoliae) TaxID=655384 RepID=A0A451DGN4_9GAMM|nr:bifunctional aspartate kinase/homoserine dehydrogenase I [Buchnera aphidicola]VFP85786.1 Bifunctional aspartokinase/homoserine dehydrogenase 1 [Buchnera aphidicola (Cinara pseudotaxifoliae)]